LLLLAAAGACGSRPSPRTPASPVELSAPSYETRPCEGPTAIPPEVDAALTKLESPERSHCELHRLFPGAPPLLFVRTMNTVGHDDEGRALPACQWEVFRSSGTIMVHAATLDGCSLRFENGCVLSLDEGRSPRAPEMCFDPTGFPH
jgi:hypothetical protein